MSGTTIPGGDPAACRPSLGDGWPDEGPDDDPPPVCGAPCPKAPGCPGRCLRNPEHYLSHFCCDCNVCWDVEGTTGT